MESNDSLRTCRPRLACGCPHRPALALSGSTTHTVSLEAAAIAGTGDPCGEAAELEANEQIPALSVS